MTFAWAGIRVLSRLITAESDCSFAIYYWFDPVDKYIFNVFAITVLPTSVHVFFLSSFDILLYVVIS